MRLAERTDYGLRVLMLLAAAPERRTVPEMAGALCVSAHHLNKVVQALQAAGWVETTRGRSGGVELACHAGQIRIGAVVRGMEPDLHLVECLREDGRCTLAGPCRLVDALVDAREAFLDTLDQMTLADLVRGRQKKLVQVTKHYST